MRILRLSGPLVAMSLLLVLGITSWTGGSPSIAVAPADAGPSTALRTGMAGELTANAGAAATGEPGSDAKTYLPAIATSKLHLGASYIVYTDGTTIYASMARRATSISGARTWRP